MPEFSLAERYEAVRQRLRRAERLAARAEDTVSLLAVSKRQSASQIRALHALGQRDFGENYLQEAVAKQNELKDIDLSWHFIGPLQRNKTAEVAANFDWVHSVDRLVLAERLSNQRPKHMLPLNICLQVNLEGETSKSGCTPDALPELAHAVSQLPRLRLRGLMTLPAPGSVSAFAQLADSLKYLQGYYPHLDTLSMGMSADLEPAVAAGATWVRVGTAIFGHRN
ncbi:MAG: YggS family pyridoxal phosphate-dependent enzyme [Pseudomonadales bacterium]|nr:YggS family pyridoxal phosphate-dependent enzyme [Pseudomonadales bacterium]